MKFRHALLVLVALALGLAATTPALAADCSAIETRSAGSYTVQSFYLLDSDTASATGTVCDLSTWGAAEKLRVSVTSASGCASGYSAGLNGRNTSGGIAVDLGGVRSDSTATVIDGPLPKFVGAVSTGLSGCTDFDLVGELFFPNSTNATNAATGCDELIWAEVNPTEAGATPDFIDFLDHAGSTTANNEDNFLVHQARKAHQVSCVVATAPGAGDEWTFTLQQGAAGSLTDTSLVCRVQDTNTSCTSTGSVDITAANYIMGEIESDEGATDPATNALITCSLCLGN